MKEQPKRPALADLIGHINISSSQRRQHLINEMARLKREGFHCFSCSGVCCTFVANSMQTTPTETLELLAYLAREKRINQELTELLRETVRRYRLDQEPPGDGRRTFSRRTYTCPFFAGGKFGCTLSREAKPYGCLGFNPLEPDQTEGGNCASNTELLQQREQVFAASERESDQFIQEQLEICWKKLPMPLALLKLLEKISVEN